MPGNELPRDFADIPDDSPKAGVKASLAGAREAQEASAASRLPQSAAASFVASPPAWQMNSSVALAPIEGTPLHYVPNSVTPIIEVKFTH